MIHRTKQTIEDSKKYTTLRGISINPKIIEIEKLNDIPVLDDSFTEDALYICDDIKIPIVTEDFFYNFFYKERIGYELEEDFTFNEYIKGKEGDFVFINLGRNKTVSDITLVINGKEKGICNSIINFESKKISILDLNKDTIYDFIRDINSYVK